MEFQRFTKKNLIINAAVIVAYLIWMSIVGGIKQDQFVLIGIWLTAYYAHEKSRKLILGFSVFIIFWIIYDSMRIIPNYEVSPAHIREPYEFEKLLFGIHLNGNLLTPNEYFAIVNSTIADFLAGFFYINWMPVPIGFGIYLYLKNKELFLQYSFAFLLINLIGFCIYYIYPAAPPWYVEKYGFDLHIGVPGNRAGLERFDNLIGIPVFESIYNKNANVLAAMPSLHSAYPAAVLYFAVKNGAKIIGKILLSVFMVGIWMSAVYSGHHYVIDVLAGIITAIFSLFIFEKIILNTKAKDKICNFSKII